MNSLAIKPEMTSVLSNLTDLLRAQTIPVDRFLQEGKKAVVTNPFRCPGDLGIAGEVADHLGKVGGMRRLIVDRSQSGPPPASIPSIVSNSSVIEFADWAAVDNASGTWDRLYTQVIKPLGRQDTHFIFHLGDIAKKQVFEVDEVLDIIGDYSNYGNVTLMLDDSEADHLWSQLNGNDPLTFTLTSETPAPGSRYASIFRTMSINSLIILFPTLAVHFSRDGLFDVGKHGKNNDRRMFSIGYQLGLLLGLDVLHCTALGVALSGIHPGQPVSGPASSLLINTIQNWLQLL